MLPAIFSLSGPVITADERALFASANPVGYILFRRNIVDPDQLLALTDDLRAIAGRERILILVDQEGGRVARMRSPHWPDFPPAQVFGALYARSPIAGIEAARANARALGHMLRASGLTVNCSPMVDLTHPGSADAIMGDRCFSADPLVVASLGRAVLEGLAEGGCLGLIKHLPGHGRAMVDSHFALPIVDAEDSDLADDLLPFARLSDAAIGMTGHIVFRAWDALRPATVSPVVVEGIIRGRIGFDGLLLTDDIGMKALNLSAENAMVEALAAGCDLALHCSGEFAEMAAMAATGLPMRPATMARLERALALIPDSRASGPAEDLAEALAQRDALLAQG